ncbi:hypothetical protein F4774DRAFT_410170 [Daldinia eschscholtzii]|nr:hypothetical protein F4774DRAFT_410170 [Daldinia eschscholtzii]
MLDKKSYSFYIFLMFARSATKRHSWAYEDGEIKLKEDQFIHCTARIIGQLQDRFMTKAGYEPDTPTNSFRKKVSASDFRKGLQQRLQRGAQRAAAKSASQASREEPATPTSIAEESDEDIFEFDTPETPLAKRKRTE